MVAVVADDVETTDPARYRARLLLVSDAFVVRGMATVGEAEMRALGRDAVELLARRRNEISFRSEGGQIHLWLAPRGDGEVAVAGRIVRDDGPAYSAFETRTDRGGLEAFADGLRAFPFARG